MNSNKQITIPISPLNIIPDDRKTTLLVDANGNIICDNMPYILPVPYSDSYVLGILGSRRVLIDCKRDIKNNTVLLDVPIKIMSNITNLICVGVENSECIAKETDIVKEWAKNCYFKVWCRTIFTIEYDNYMKFYYVSTDKKALELEGYPNILSEKYCRINHFNKTENTYFEIIYKSESDKPDLVKLLPNSNISYVNSYTIRILSQIAGMKDVSYCDIIIYRTETHWFYGIFEDYTDRIPYSPSIAPNEFFSINDELKIRKIKVFEIINEPYMLVSTNADDKKNIIMLDGDMLFDTWVEDIEFDDIHKKCIVSYENKNGLDTKLFDTYFIGSHIKTSDKIYLQEHHE